MTARPDVPDTPDRTHAALATIDEVRALPVVATLTIPLWDRASVENEIHTSRTSATVPVVIKPDLPILGHVLYEHHYATTEVFIVLREWNEQVLLHEVLHVILGPGPVEDPDNHRIVNAVEVGLAPFFVARSPWGDVVADAFNEWPAYCRCGASGTTTRREAAENTHPQDGDHR